MVPKWAVDLTKVRETSLRQKKSQMDKATFGVLREIKNIDIREIFGSNVWGYDFRGASGEWPDMLSDMEKNH